MAQKIESDSLHWPCWVSSLHTAPEHGWECYFRLPTCGHSELLFGINCGLPGLLEDFLSPEQEAGQKPLYVSFPLAYVQSSTTWRGNSEQASHTCFFYLFLFPFLLFTKDGISTSGSYLKGVSHMPFLLPPFLPQ